ncbi:MAG: hypothetical protein ACFCUT_02455 [Kiloniellaceae bacterium]
MADGDRLSKSQTIATIFATVAIPVILSVLGYVFNDNLKTRDARLRTTELAIAILRDDPKNSPETPSLRQWAVTVIDDFSGVPFPEAAKKELQQNRLVTADRYTMTFEDRLVSHIDHLWEELERRGVDRSDVGCYDMVQDDPLSKFSNLIASGASEQDYQTYNMLSNLRAACWHFHGLN